MGSLLAAAATQPAVWQWIPDASSFLGLVQSGGWPRGVLSTLRLFDSKNCGTCDGQLRSNKVMGVHRWMSSAYLITALTTPAVGCFCFSTPMCSQIGTLSRSRSVFIGRVVEVWPAREVLARQQDMSRAQLRHLILQRWSGVLSAEEERYIRTSPEWDKIESRYAYMQRIRFVVTETFTGPEIHEIYTDSSSCGYSFKSNRVYLVDSSLDGPLQHRRLFANGECGI
jgi:hypothetical protein